MFRLPVCPHCGTVYRYHEVLTSVTKKEITCYHCHKGFRARIFPRVLIEAVILAAVCIGVNVLILSRMRELSLIPLFLTTAGFLLLIFLLMPFFLSFRRTEQEPHKYKNHQQNVKRSNKKKS